MSTRRCSLPDRRRARAVARLLGWALALLLAACAPAAADPLPTVTLVPPTATALPTAIPPTATPAELFNPADLAAAATPEPLRALLPSVAIAADDITQLRQTLADALAITPRDILWLDGQPAQWRFRSSRCHPPAPHGRVQGVVVRLLVGTTIFSFQRQGDDRYRLCRDSEQARDGVLTTIDPVAAELVRLARQAVAAQLDLPLRRVQLHSAQAFRWWDTSLGCPLAGQRYEQADVPGYRIVVTAGDVLYAFHTDSARLFPCAAGAEVLTPPSDRPLQSPGQP